MIDNNRFTALSSLYEKYFGGLPEKIVCLKGDGSDREVYRISSHKYQTVIGIYGPNREENEAFVSFSHSFYTINLPVPKILAYDATRNVYLEDDLGNTTLFDWYENMTPFDQSGIAEKTYKKVLSWLVQFQFNGNISVDYTKCYQFPAFEKDAIQFDLDYFTNSFLKRFALSSINYIALEQDFNILIQKLVEAKADYFLYRDFQSRNIMLQDDNIYFIDYQSGRKGALQYDVASLLFDANLRLDNSLRDSLLDYYIKIAGEFEVIDSMNFKVYYYDFALVRMLQALAAFSHLALDKEKMYFLKNIPIALENISTLLEKQCILHDLKELKRLFVDDLFFNPKFKGKHFR